MATRRHTDYTIDSSGNVIPEVINAPALRTSSQTPNTGASPLTLASLFAQGKQFVNNNWSAKGGLNLKNVPGIGNMNVGKYAPTIQGIASAGQAIGGISDYAKSTSDYNDLVGDVLREANSNPLANYYLTNSQQSDLRKLKRDGLNAGEAGFGDFLKGVGSGLGDAIAPTLLGLVTGGVPGAFVGGIGSLVNSGIGGMNNKVAQDTADLEALYQALADANTQYQSMKRIPMQGLGLQQKYVNMYQ